MLLTYSQYIDVPGAKAICKALKTNQHLRFIDLGLNKVRKVSNNLLSIVLFIIVSFFFLFVCLFVCLCALFLARSCICT